MRSISKQLGQAIKSRRKELGFSQEKLAEKSQLHRTYISDVERGKRNVTIISLSKILSGLEISFEEFFSMYYKK
jgi:transcriptional regulator with XRE-family HTH domain